MPLLYEQGDKGEEFSVVAGGAGQLIYGDHPRLVSTLMKFRVPRRPLPNANGRTLGPNSEKPGVMAIQNRAIRDGGGKTARKRRHRFQRPYLPPQCPSSRFVDLGCPLRSSGARSIDVVTSGVSEFGLSPENTGAKK